MYKKNYCSCIVDMLRNYSYRKSTLWYLFKFLFHATYRQHTNYKFIIEIEKTQSPSVFHQIKSI